MSKLSISEAHRATGKARSTIERHIADGTLSAEKNEAGRAFIDVSELQRVYGEVNAAAIKKAKQKPAALQDATTENDAELQLIQQRLAFTEQRLEEAQHREREEKERHRETQTEKERLLALVEQYSKIVAALPISVAQEEVKPAVEQLKPTKRGFWRRLFG